MRKCRFLGYYCDYLQKFRRDGCKYLQKTAYPHGQAANKHNIIIKTLMRPDIVPSGGVLRVQHPRTLTEPSISIQAH